MTKKNIEAVYKLSPMQEGMLFHTLLDPASGVYFLQLSCTLYGALNEAAFKRAWERVVERHAVLRTAFYWEEHDKPLQVVYRHVEIPWSMLDWRDIPESEQADRFKALLQADRERGFDVSQAPLLRWTVIQVADDRYYFVWSSHHLLLDGWCQPLILNEIFALYEAFCQGRSLHLPSRRPYRDYIAWLQRQDLSAAEAFWRKTLAGFTTPTVLHVDQIGAAGSHAEPSYAEEQITLPTTIVSALQALCRQHQLTLNTVVQGAWALLLSKYSGENDVVFGATVSGRPPELPGVEEMIGLFINTLPIRVQIDREAQVLSWLKDLQAHQVDLRQYEYSPLVQVQGWSEVPRSTSLFETLLVFENYPIDDSLGQGNAAATVEVRQVRFVEQNHYPLALLVVPGRTLDLRLSYDRQRFAADVIEQMLRQLQMVLSGFAATPDQRLADVTLIGAAEREQLLQHWNATTVAYPAQHTLHELVAAQAARTPAAIALICDDDRLTYAMLNARANQLAHHLQQLGVGPETCVGLCLTRSADLVVALLAILKAGGAYVPLDPAYPPERLAFMLEDSQATVLVTQQHVVSLLQLEESRHQVQVVCLDADRERIAAQPTEDLISTSSANNLAYVIFTSGSTGKPKGVAIQHSSATAMVHWACDVFTPAALAGVLASTSVCFDLSIFELFVPLSSGNTVILVENLLQLPGLPAAQQVTLVNTVPSLMAELLRSGSLPESVHTVNLAGEPLPLSLVQQLYQHATISQVFNLYGPSEDTTYSTFALIPPDSTAAPSIGRPIANTQAYVLDRSFSLVPLGLPGELYLGGLGIARGYLNRPDLTAERFIPDPFSRRAGARLYKTGDLVRFHPDGQLAYLGRLDQQVKLRGFRIELGEIEATLRQHPHVRDSAVVMHASQPGDQGLVAYVVGEPGAIPKRHPAHEEQASNEQQGLNAQELRRFLRSSLPDFMVPARFVVLEAFPLTPNGKLDRRALPAPDELARDADTPYVAPRTSSERLLSQLWTEALGRERVGIHDNFFDLGGHSLIALQLLARIRERFQIKLPLRQLFEAPTVAELALVLDMVKDVGLEIALIPKAEVDLQAEARLDPAISIAGLPPRSNAEPAAIFVTGVTGFLGAFLLYELLHSTRADVYCLVRAQDQTAAQHKIQSHLESYGLWSPEVAPRIVPVIGDLALPHLGLPVEQWRSLCRTLDTIYHNGALVNFAYPYSVMKAPNVLGTQELLRLATETRLKALHFVSTNGIFASAAYAQAGLVREDDPLTDCTGLAGGYAQSKWVAEKLVMAARARGVPVCIYRPGRIGWHSQSGMWNQQDVLCKIITGCLQLGLAPDVDQSVELTPVDYISRAIVRLSLREQSLGQAFHLVNPQPVSWPELVSWLRQSGAPLQLVPYAEWFAALNQASTDPARNALYPLVAMAAEQAFESRAADQHAGLRFDLHHTLSGLADPTFSYPQVDPALVRPLAEHLAQTYLLNIK